MHAAARFQPLPRSSPEPFQTLEYSRAGSRQMEVVSILPRYSRASALFLTRRATAAGTVGELLGGSVAKVTPSLRDDLGKMFNGATRSRRKIVP